MPAARPEDRRNDRFSVCAAAARLPCRAFPGLWEIRRGRPGRMALSRTPWRILGAALIVAGVISLALPADP